MNVQLYIFIQVTDFGICEVGRLYQTSLNFHNRLVLAHVDG